MLLYLEDFESLQIIQSLRDFAECDYEALARSLWVKYKEEPKALLLIANIMFDYSVPDSELWRNVLDKLYGYEMV
jgi:hypothetical protein